MSLRRVIAMPALARVQQRAMSTTPRLGLKESSSQTNEDYEKHKQDSLQKQKQGKAEWKRELASDSEEAVRAEKEGSSIAEMQRKTKQDAEQARK